MRKEKGYTQVFKAQTLLLKIAHGESADAMVSRYQRMVDDGYLKLRRAPHQNSLSHWLNDARMTPVLQWFLRVSASPFRRREVSAIIDSSKVSQLRTAHSRYVEYGSDERDNAQWAKCHAIVGAETGVVMHVMFSQSQGENTHDSKFLKDLVSKAQQTFKIEHVLADKAYLSEAIVGWLWRQNIKAIIPVKKKWDYTTKKLEYEACRELVEWYDRKDRSFEEAFRFRVKIEALFSHLKRLADGYCWSRGRLHELEKPEDLRTAWINELLCKFIYLNLRITVTHEVMTAYHADYLADDVFFPAPRKRVIDL
jgi:hypothetical protein